MFLFFFAVKAEALSLKCGRSSFVTNLGSLKLLFQVDRCFKTNPIEQNITTLY